MFVYLLFVTAIIWIFSEYIGGNNAVFIGGMIGALFYVIITYFTGSKMALALNGAKQIQKSDNPRLYRIVENTAITDGLPMPKVYIIDDPGANAFATGRDPKNASVAATSGILDLMTDTELEGVIAHEMGHVKNYDIRVSMVAFALTAFISLLADMILRITIFGGRDRDNNQLMLFLGLAAAILAPIVAVMIQLAISRQREYLADATGALTTRYPEGLASALEKLEQGNSVVKRQNTSTAHLYFANPLKKGGIAGLFSTHPPIEDRVERLRKMGNHA